MTYLILGAAVAAVAGVAHLLRREATRWQEGGPAFRLLGPLRIVSGAIFILLILLLAGGLVFALPRPGVHEPSAMMATYWVFVMLLTLVLMLLTMFDFMLVRRGFQRRQDEALREALLGPTKQQAAQSAEPDADRPY
jgi:hypothetical protein